MPSAPEKIGARGEAERPPATREYESSDQFEGFEFTLAAGAGFQQVVQFAGRPDAIVLRVVGTQLRVRFREPGEAANQPYVIQGGTTEEFKVAGRIVEMQDPGAAGTQFVSGYGRYASRHIERRQGRRGPLRTTVHDYETAAPEQVTPR